MKLFISYRSLESAKVDSIAAKLRAIEDTNGQKLYTVWQDKHNIPDGHNWWDAIVNAIIDCNVFIFMVSKEACTSPVCRAELHYAFLRNRPIVPIVLEGEYFYDRQTAKNNLRFWDVIPNELTERKAQFLFYEGGNFAERLANAIREFQTASHRWQDKEAQRPVDPSDKDDVNSDDVFDIYDMAVDYAYRMEFQIAERYFLRLINSADDTFHHESDKWVDILRAYNNIKKFASRRSAEHRLMKEWTTYQKKHYPVDFIAGIFDPFDIAGKLALNDTKSTDEGVDTPNKEFTDPVIGGIPFYEHDDSSKGESIVPSESLDTPKEASDDANINFIEGGLIPDIHIRRGMPNNAQKIADFKTSYGKNGSISRMDAMMSFGQRSYIMAQDNEDNILALMGWTVEYQITRMNDFHIKTSISVKTVVHNILRAIEDASIELGSKVAFIFLVTDTIDVIVNAFKDDGYTEVNKRDITIPSWREAIENVLYTHERLVLWKRL